tara:strand:- start:503 stop:808 length:306 start_codon:yes stop_codon:yes gene_type:complete
MRPQKADRIVRKCIENYIASGFTLKFINEKLFLSAVKRCGIQLRKEFSEIGIGYDNRHPLDVDIDCYTPEYIDAEICHISDRFRAPHRLNWLEFGLDNNKF